MFIGILVKIISRESRYSINIINVKTYSINRIFIYLCSTNKKKNYKTKNYDTDYQFSINRV